MILNRPHRRMRRRDGSAVIIVFALLAMMLMFAAANMRTLNLLSGELRLLEQQQVQNLERLQPPSATTNTTVVEIEAVED